MQPNQVEVHLDADWFRPLVQHEPVAIRTLEQPRRGSVEEGGAVVLGIDSAEWERWEIELQFTAAAELAGFLVRPRQARPATVTEMVEWRRRGDWPRVPIRFPAGAPMVTRRMLREVPLGELERFGRRVFQKRSRTLLDGWESVQLAFLDDATGERAERLRQWKAAPLRPGRRGQPDAYYAVLAAEYVALVNSGSKRPNADLAERRNLNTQTVTNQLYEADHGRGLLAGRSKGKAGGVLTEKALRLLADI